MICNVCNRVRPDDMQVRLNVCVECHEEDVRQEMRAAEDMEAFRCKECGWAVPWDQRMMEPTPEPGTYVCRNCRYLVRIQKRYPLVEPDLLEREEEEYTEWERLERKIVWD